MTIEVLLVLRRLFIRTDLLIFFFFACLMFHKIYVKHRLELIERVSLLQKQTEGSRKDRWG